MQKLSFCARYVHLLKQSFLTEKSTQRCVLGFAVPFNYTVCVVFGVFFSPIQMIF